MLKKFPTIVWVFFLLLGFSLAIFGILLLRREAGAGAFLLTASGLIITLFSSSRIIGQAPSEEDVAQLRQHGRSFIALFLSLILLFVVLVIIGGDGSNATQEKFANSMWLLSLVLLTGGVLLLDPPKIPIKQRLKDYWQTHRNDILALGIILLIALAARLILINGHPYPWSGDEASVGSEGRRILNGEISNFFETGWSGQPNWSFWPTAISLSIFGENILGIRMVSVLAGVLSVLFIYLLGREMFGKMVGRFAAAFLALYPIHLHFSRIGVNNINDSLMIALVLWLILRAVRSKRLLDYTLAGILSGLTIYTYVGTRLVLLIGLGALGYSIIFARKELREHIQGIGAYLYALLISAGPMAYFFSKHPDIFMNRLNQESVLLSGWLGQQAQATGQTIGQLLLQQFSRSVLVFISSPAPGNFYNSPKPYLTVAGAIFALLGMFISLQKIRKKEHLVLQAWFWSVITLGGILTLNPPANTRMVMTTPAVALFIGLGIQQVAKVLTQLRLPMRQINSVAVVLLLILGAENAIFYFKEYREGYFFQEANAEVAMELGFQLQDLGSSTQLVFIGHPRVFSGFPTITFLAPDNAKYDFPPDQIDAISIDQSQDALFVLIPENQNLLPEISETYPGGSAAELARKAKEGEILYYYYHWTAK